LCVVIKTGEKNVLSVASNYVGRIIIGTVVRITFVWCAVVARIRLAVSDRAPCGESNSSNFVTLRESIFFVPKKTQKFLLRIPL